MIFDLIYLSILFFGTYFLIFHLNLWFENKNKILGDKCSKNSSFLPHVSLILPAYNESDIIEKTLRKVSDIDYPRDKFEVIFVDDGSTDGTYGIAKNFKSKLIKVFSKKNSGKAGALNFGIAKSKGEFIAVMDADTYLDKGALKNCMKYFDDEDVAAVTSHIFCSKRQTFWERMQVLELMLIATTRKMQEYANVIQATPGPLSVYRKKVLKELGGFDENVLVEDIDVAWNILNNGYKIRMALDAFAYSIYPESFKRWWNQRVRWAIGGLQILQKYFHSFGKKDSAVGIYLIPSYLFGYGSIILGIGMFSYLLLTNLTNSMLYMAKAESLGMNPLSVMKGQYYIDVKVILGFIAFTLTMYLLKVSFSFYREKVNWYDVILFIFIYPLLFPFVSLMGIYKYFKGEKGWLTK